MSKSKLESDFIMLVKESKLPEPTREYKFFPSRKWKFDFAYPEIKLAIELEGGIWIQGRHSRGSGMLKDMEKYNTATVNGWRILRYTTNNLGQSVDDIQAYMRTI